MSRLSRQERQLFKEELTGLGVDELRRVNNEWWDNTPAQGEWWQVPVGLEVKLFCDRESTCHPKKYPCPVLYECVVTQFYEPFGWTPFPLSYNSDSTLRVSPGYKINGRYRTNEGGIHVVELQESGAGIQGVLSRRNMSLQCPFCGYEIEARSRKLSPVLSGFAHARVRRVSFSMVEKALARVDEVSLDERHE